jgi:hypothetical protein
MDPVYAYLIASFKVFPALKAGSFIAGILIVSLGFRGFTPFLADLFETRNVPNPVIVTFSPFFRDFVIASSIESRTSPAAFLVTPVFSAAPATKSCLVMHCRVKKLFLHFDMQIALYFFWS